MSKWRTMLKTFNKVAAMLLSLQLILSPLAPVFLTQPVFAQEADFEVKTQFELQYLVAENELRVEVGDETELPFGIYYYDEIDGQVEAAEGKLTAEDHSIYFGTCSDGICTADEASRGVLKVRDGDKITALKFELIEEEVGLVEKHDSDEMGLSEDELGWVEGDAEAEILSNEIAEIDSPSVLGRMMSTFESAFSLMSVNATPSTNDVNRDKGWAHVNVKQAKLPGRITFEFVSTRSFASCFEYRIDGDTSQKVKQVNENIFIDDGEYPSVCVNNSNVSKTIHANEYIEIRMVYGAESDERFDWTRFDVKKYSTNDVNRANKWPHVNFIKSSPNGEITLSFDKQTFGSIKYQARIDGGAPKTVSLNSTGVTEKTFTVTDYVEVRMSASPESDYLFDWTKFSLDKTSPQMNNFRISKDIINSKSNGFNIDGQITDNQSRIESVKFALWNKDKSKVFYNWTTIPAADGNYDELSEEVSHWFDISNLGDGEYVLGIRGWDLSENKANGGDHYFTIDRTPPVITNIKVNPEVSGKIAGEVIVTFDVIEAGTGFDEGYCYVKFVDNNDFESPYTVQESGSYKCVNTANNSYQAVVNTRDFVREGYLGTYNLKFRFRDLANNNRSSKPKKYLIDNKAPNVPTGGTHHEELLNTNIFNLEWNDVSNGETGITYDYHSTKNPAEVDGVLTHVQYTKSGLTSPKQNANGTPDGTWYWQVRSVDEVGNKSAWSEIWNVTVDTQAPDAPELISPGDQKVLSHNKTPLIIQEWTEEDDAVEYQYQSCAVDPGDEGEICSRIIHERFQKGVEKGVDRQASIHFWWRVRARDAAGNWSSWSESYELTIDNDAPVISWDNDQDLITNDSTPNLTGKANDIYLAGIDQVNYQIKDQSGIILRDWTPANYNEGAFSFSPAELADGEYLIRVQAIDNAGNKSNILEKEVIIDTLAPEVSITSPAEGGFVAGEVFITADVSDSNLWRYYLVILNDQGKVVAGPGTIYHNGPDAEINYTWLTNNDPDGEYTIRLEARDKANNKKSAVSVKTVKVIIDNAHPSSLINLPEGSSEIVSESEGSEITAFNNLWNGELTGTATDNEGVANVQLSIQRTAGSDNYYWDGSAWIAGSGDEVKFPLNPTDAPAKNVDWQYSLPAEHVKDGVTYVIRSHAEDVAGNVESTHQLTIIVDKTIPEVELTINPAAPDGKNSWYVTRPTITLTVTDENFDSLQYKWDDGSWESVAEKTVSTQVPSEGSHVLYYSAFDKANNFSATEEGIKSVRWDETGLDEGPQSIKVNPNPTSGTTAEVSWGKAHDNVNVDKYQIEWRLNDSDTRHSKTVNSTTFSTEIDQLTEGTWQVKVTAFDAVGNSKSASKELIVDRSAPAAPTVTLISTGEGSAFLGWTEIEDAANYLIFYGTTSGEHIYGANVGQVTEYEVQGLGAGSYYFVVRAMDAAHNQSDNSNEVNTGQIAGAAGVEPGAPATDFAPAGEVQGVSTDEAVMAAADGEDNGEVLGTTQELNNWLQQRLPWVLLAIQLLLLLLIENVLKREPGLLKHLLSIIVTLVVIALAVLLINPSQYQAGTMLRLVADWYIPAAIALLILVKAYSYAFIEEVG